MSQEARTAGGHWGVATPHRAASEAGAAVLASGGTAVDAAICAAGVLCVVYPHNCALGGDLIGLVRQGNLPPRAVFGVGRAGAGVDVEALRRAHGDRMPVTGPPSITVPGIVSGWAAMHEIGGSVPFARLFEPAIELAAGGFVVGGSLARALGELVTDDAGMAEIFGPPGARVGAGALLVQARLAETIAQVGEDPDGYYRGALAGRLADALASAGSALDIFDFHAHRAVVAGALETEAGRLAPRLFTAGLPSQGAFLGDLVSVLRAHVEDGRALMGKDAHLLATAFGEFSQRRDELLCDPSRQTAHPRGDTVAIVTADAAGGSVSMLQSLFFGFGAKICDPETGVVFHNRGAMFTLRRGAPGELAPGVRPPHTLCPAMVDGDDGAPALHISTMGGRAQPQILSRVLLHLHAGKELKEAIESPRYVVGDTGTAGSYTLVTAEQDVSPEELGSLADAGFDVCMVGKWDESTGHAQALRVGDDGAVQGASDPRSDGSAICGR